MGEAGGFVIVFFIFLLVSLIIYGLCKCCMAAFPEELQDEIVSSRPVLNYRSRAGSNDGVFIEETADDYPRQPPPTSRSANYEERITEEALRPDTRLPDSRWRRYDGIVVEEGTEYPRQPPRASRSRNHEPIIVEVVTEQPPVRPRRYDGIIVEEGTEYPRQERSRPIQTSSGQGTIGWTIGTPERNPTPSAPEDDS